MPFSATRIGLLAIFFLLNVLGLAQNATAAVKISTISPTCAGIGATIVIKGQDFGGPNVRISVGGVRAQVVSATGARVTFVAPTGVPQGLTTVAATNPGGSTGTIGIQIKGVELCGNHLDDDCDGATDEGFDVGSSCTVGVGACQRSGAKVCSTDGKSTVCNATPGTPTAEVCNGIDDNCNGQVDEGVSQTLTCGVGACTRTVASCVNGQPQTCVPGTPTAEVCGNGIDDNCNGAVDEGFDVGAACSVGVGACAKTGVKICTADGASTVCNAMPGSPGPELCGNGIDDNCNGQVDEGFDVGAACSAGVGACARSHGERAWTLVKRRS